MNSRAHELIKSVENAVSQASDPLVQWVLEKAKHDERFLGHGTSLSTRLYEGFTRKHQEKKRRNVKFRMETYYDTNSYECRDIPGKQPGSLRLLFDYYCKLMTPSGATTRLDLSNGLTYDLIQVANATISLPELMVFVNDFQIVPNLTSVAAVHFCWQRQRRGRKYDQTPTELDFKSFVEVIVRIALIAFDQEPDPKERVAEIIRYLDLKQTHKYKKMLKSLQDSRKWNKKTKSGVRSIPQTIVKPEAVRRHRETDAEKKNSPNEEDMGMLEEIPGQRQVSRQRKAIKINFQLESKQRPKWATIQSATIKNDSSKQQDKVRPGTAPAYASTETQNRVRKAFWEADALFSQALVDFLCQYEYENDRERWLPFDGEYIDMGVLVQGTKHMFRVDVRNAWRDSLSVFISLSPSLSDMSVTFDGRTMPSGMHRKAFLQVDCTIPGERVGYLKVTASDCRGRPIQTRELPVYLHIVPRRLQIDTQFSQESNELVGDEAKCESEEEEQEQVDDDQLQCLRESSEAEGRERGEKKGMLVRSETNPDLIKATSTLSAPRTPTTMRSRANSTIVTGLSLPSPQRRLTSASDRRNSLERKPLPLSLVHQATTPKSLITRRLSFSVANLDALSGTLT